MTQSPGRLNELVPRRVRAQSMLEFALAFPMFMFVMLGIFDWSRLLITQISITNSARELARAAAISTYTDQQILDSFNNTLLMLGPSATDSLGNRTDSVTISVYDQHGNFKGTTTCTGMPMSGCMVPDRRPAAFGYVEVRTSFEFVFSPFFESFFSRVVGFGFPKPGAYTHTVKAFIE